MAWSFRKRIKVIPGIHLNISKSSISTTIGVRGASVNLGRNGAFLNTGIPGTGLYSRQKIGGGKTQLPDSSYPEIPKSFEISSDKVKTPDSADNIFSLDVEEITSHDMQGIKQTVLSAHQQRLELLQDLKLVQQQLQKNRFKLLLSYWLLYGFLWKEKTRFLKEDMALQQHAIAQIEKQTQNTAVQLDFDFDEEMNRKYQTLHEAFGKLCESQIMWDITAEHANDRFVTRSAAATSVVRKRIRFKTGHLPEIKSQIPAMIWDNANGADLYFYPNFMVVWNNRKHFAIVAYNELDINFTATRFIETEKVPSDTKVIDQTWYKVNKNGTPDKRFKNNYKIPVVRYGDLELNTKTGLNERYLFSNYEHTDAFNRAFVEYQIALVQLEYVPKAALEQD